MTVESYIDTYETLYYLEDIDAQQIANTLKNCWKWNMFHIDIRSLVYNLAYFVWKNFFHLLVYFTFISEFIYLQKF